jgi:hypothetical protein
MVGNDHKNFHVEYMDATQHWCATSEKYAGGDCLATALNRGWQMSPVIKRETRWYAGNRFVYLYHFTLTRETDEMVMPVITNPFIERLIAQPALELQTIEER